MNRLEPNGISVHVLRQSPAFYNDVQILFAQSGLPAVTRRASAPLSFDRVVNQNLSNSLPPSTFIDPLQHLCHASDCPYREDGQFLVTNAGHFSDYGSKLAVASYFPLFIRSARSFH